MRAARYRPIVDHAEEGARIAADLTGWLARLAFTDQTTNEVTNLLIDSVAAWAMAQGWRVYRRAASVMPLPPPYAHRKSIVDLGCARPAGAPVVVEVDHSDRRRTIEKLRLEAEAGRIPIWVRWGERGLEPAPAPIATVAFHVSSRPGPGRVGRLHSRSSATHRPAPMHSRTEIRAAEQVDLFATTVPDSPAQDDPADDR